MSDIANHEVRGESAGSFEQIMTAMLNGCPLRTVSLELGDGLDLLHAMTAGEIMVDPNNPRVPYGIQITNSWGQGVPASNEEVGD